MSKVKKTRSTYWVVIYRFTWILIIAVCLVGLVCFWLVSLRRLVISLVAVRLVSFHIIFPFVGSVLDGIEGLVLVFIGGERHACVR